jgi:hypothetical protein
MYQDTWHDLLTMYFEEVASGGLLAPFVAPFVDTSVTNVSMVDWIAVNVFIIFEDKNSSPLRGKGTGLRVDAGGVDITSSIPDSSPSDPSS